MRTPLLQVAALALSLPTSAQEPVPLVLEGDSVAGVGSVTRIENLAIRDSGEWLVEVDTDNADTDIDGALLRGGTLLLQEGGALAEPAGASVGSFDSLVLDASGRVAQNLLLTGAVTTADNAGVYVDSTLVIRKGDTSLAPGYGGVHGSFSDVKLTSGGLLYLRGFGDDPNVSGTSDWFAIVASIDGAGNLLSETVVAREGDTPAGQSLTINTIRSGAHAGAINSSGDVIWCADLDTGSPPMDAVCYRGNVLLAQEGAPSPVPGRNWGDIISPEVDLNDAGDWTFKDRLDSSDFTSDEIIIKNGAVFRREGQSLPAIAPFTFERFGNGPVDLTQAGDVLWYADWDDADTNRDEGLFLNDELLVQEGVTQVGALTVDDVGDQSDNYFISPSGNFVIFEATLSDGREGAFLLTLGLGTNYCVGAANSAGPGARMSAAGSPVVADQDLTLATQGAPAGVPGLYFFGPSQVQLPFGDGFRCAGGQVRRIQPPAFADGAGVAARSLDFGAPYGVAITPGARLNFQYWYRDPMAGMAGFNLSDGLEIEWH